MRISTSMLYDRGLAAINQAQSTLSTTQQQIASGHRVNTASDDPVAAAEILRTNSQLANNTQYISNQGAAQSTLGQTDTVLGQVTDLLQSVRTTLVSANSGALADSDRKAIATQLGSQLAQLVSLANSRDGNGAYIFGGYRTDTTPFAQSATGVSYAGDDGNRAVQVSPTRQIGVSLSGADVFNRITSGNGVFTTTPSASNTGNGIIDTGQVVTPTALTGHAYSVQFSVSGSTTTYQVTDTTTGSVVAAPTTGANAFTSGTAITVDGQQFTISGAPANGDRFDVAPAGKQSVFQTLQNAVNLLGNPSGGAAGLAKITSGVLGSMQNIDNALNSVLDSRATVGVRQNELTALGTISANYDTEGQSRLTDLQDTDYAKATGDLAKEQAGLTAAQKILTTLGGKSLFDYL
jgi:flagellar hook-associated protein 3 FlgL